MFFFINNTNNEPVCLQSIGLLLDFHWLCPLEFHWTSIGFVHWNSIGLPLALSIGIPSVLVISGGWFVVSPLAVHQKSRLDWEVRPEMLGPALENHWKSGRQKSSFTIAKASAWRSNLDGSKQLAFRSSATASFSPISITSREFSGKVRHLMLELRLVIKMFPHWPGGKNASSSEGNRVSALSKTIAEFSLREPIHQRADSSDPSSAED